MSTRNFAQRYPKHIKQFIKGEHWYMVNVRTDTWHCRYNPDQETKDRLAMHLLEGRSGIRKLRKVEELTLRSYSRIFS